VFYPVKPHPCAAGCGKVILSRNARCWACGGYEAKRKKRDRKLTVCRQLAPGDLCPEAFRPIVVARLKYYARRAREELPLFVDIPAPQGGAAC
jgi:hypothetical protein